MFGNSASKQGNLFGDPFDNGNAEPEYTDQPPAGGNIPNWDSDPFAGGEAFIDQPPAAQANTGNLFENDFSMPSASNGSAPAQPQPSTANFFDDGPAAGVPGAAAPGGGGDFGGLGGLGDIDFSGPAQQEEDKKEEPSEEPVAKTRAERVTQIL